MVKLVHVIVECRLIRFFLTGIWFRREKEFSVQDIALKITQQSTLTCLINKNILINDQGGRIFFYSFKNCCMVDFFLKKAKRACLFIRQVREE